MTEGVGDKGLRPSTARRKKEAAATAARRRLGCHCRDKAHVGETIQVCIRLEEEVKGTVDRNRMVVRNTVRWTGV